jgi:hypothetical protein
MELLWIKDGYSMIDSLVEAIAPRFMQFIPNTVWFAINAITGFNKELHMDPK